VVRDTIENSVVINGDVLAATQISIFPAVGGRVTQTFFQVGDSVSQGAVVAMVDPSRPGQIYSDSPVLSTISGTVLQAPVHRGDTVSTQTAGYVVGDLSSLVVETFVPERFSNAARRGLPAQVLLEALPGERFNALVEEINPVLDPLSRTLRIRLRFTGPTDPRIKAGMFATVSLVTNTRQNVPVIPRSAVINTYGSWIVFTVNNRNMAARREISLGLENENFVEVLRGLEPGEVVVSAGQNFLTDGDPVRIVE
jgi:RND family efflux transporter MFP subunit